MTKLRIRHAKECDLPRLLDLYEAAQCWIRSRGSDQWAGNTREKMLPRFRESIARGECYVAEDGDGRLVGTVTVDEYADPEFWTTGDEPESALYVHRMIVDRSLAGQDIGGALLDWAADLAVARGRKWLRLDAWRTNRPLHAYYKKQGFTPVRIVELPHRGSGALFQRAVDQDTSARTTWRA